MIVEADDSHEFGSDEITEVKLNLVEAYIKAYSTALKSQPWERWYIDAFAGTGSRTVRHAARAGGIFEEDVPERIERRRGSARIALEVEPKFDRLIFMEQRPKHCAALLTLKDQFPDRDITVVQGNANEIIQREIRWDGWGRTRAVLFLDPYGMSVEWETLKAVAETKAIDVWYLFSLAGLYRQAARDIAKIDQFKRSAITRMLGTDAWEKELYQSDYVHADLFGNEYLEDCRRAADVKGLESYVTQRLRDLFPHVMDPFPLPVSKKPQIFSLYFAISNDSPAAIGLARKIAGHILNAGKPSHKRSR